MLTCAQVIHDHDDHYDEFEFNNGNFNYIVKYTKNKIGSISEPVSSINIVCTHIEEFYIWSYTISEHLKDTEIDNTESGQANFIINYDPELLYKILLGYKNGDLDKMYAINFPDNFKTHEVSLVVEITSIPPYIGKKKITKLYLNLNHIGEIERCERKFLRMNELGKREQDIKIQEQNKKINHLENLVETLIANNQKNLEQMREMNNLIIMKKTDKKQTPEEKNSKIAKLATSLYSNPELRNILKDQLGLDKYITKTEFNIFEYVTDSDLSEVLSEYVKKDKLNTQITRIDLELNNCVKDIQLATFASKAELVHLATKIELNTLVSRVNTCATKTELNTLETRVNTCATKTELSTLVSRINTCAMLKQYIIESNIIQYNPIE